MNVKPWAKFVSHRNNIDKVSWERGLNHESGPFPIELRTFCPNSENLTSLV